MPKFIAEFPGAPEAVGAYSPAVMSGNHVFFSGQLGLDPESGRLVEGGVSDQAGQIMKNLQIMLEHLGLGFANVIKTTIFLSDLEDFKVVNEVYRSWMGECRPARSTVGVAALPLGAAVEIEIIAERS